MALRQLVSGHHAQIAKSPLIFAGWRKRAERGIAYLVEVADNVSDPGDASWDTYQFMAPAELRALGIEHLKITYMSPTEFWDGVRQDKSDGHRLLARIRKEGIEPLYSRKGDARAGEIEKALANGS